MGVDLFEQYGVQPQMGGTDLFDEYGVRPSTDLFEEYGGDESPGFLAGVGAFAGNLLTGLMSTAGQIVGGAAPLQKAAEMQIGDYGAAIGLPRKSTEQVARTVGAALDPLENPTAALSQVGLGPLGLLLEPLTRSIGQAYKDEDLSGYARYRIGETLKSLAPEPDPRFSGSFLAEALPQGIGSMAAFLPTGLAGPLGPAVAGIQASAGEQYEAAKAHGATEREALDAAIFGAPVGATEALPVNRLFGRLDKASGGTLKRGLGNVLRRGLVGGVEEAAQEMFQTAAGNQIARTIYDKERDLFEGVGQAGGVGGTVGFLMNTIAAAAGVRLRRPTAPPERQAQFSQAVAQNPQKAVEILSKEQPSRADFQELGVPFGEMPSAQERKDLVDELRAQLTGVQEVMPGQSAPYGTEATVEAPVWPSGGRVAPETAQEPSRPTERVTEPPVDPVEAGWWWTEGQRKGQVLDARRAMIGFLIGTGRANQNVEQAAMQSAGVSSLEQLAASVRRGGDQELAAIEKGIDRALKISGRRETPIQEVPREGAYGEEGDVSFEFGELADQFAEGEPAEIQREEQRLEVLRRAKGYRLQRLAKDLGLKVKGRSREQLIRDIVLNERIQTTEKEAYEYAREAAYEQYNSAKDLNRIISETISNEGLNRSAIVRKLRDPKGRVDPAQIPGFDRILQALEASHPMTEVELAEFLKQGPPKKPAREEIQNLAEQMGSVEWGATNTIFGRDEYLRAVERLKRPKLHVGIPADMLADLVKIGGFHVEAGLRTFSAWSMRMVHDLGDKVTPHLAEIWARIAKDHPELMAVGRPDLANPAVSEAARRLVEEVDTARMEAGEPQVRPDVETKAQAVRRLQTDYEGTKRRLLRAAEQGETLGDADTLAAKQIVNREAIGAIESGDEARILEAMRLIEAYRKTGTEQARAFRQRRDPVETPAERRARMLGEALLTPPERLRDRLDKAAPEEKQAIFKEWQEQYAGLKDDLKALGIDLDNLGGVEGIFENINLKDRQWLLKFRRQYEEWGGTWPDEVDPGKLQELFEEFKPRFTEMGIPFPENVDPGTLQSLFEEFRPQFEAMGFPFPEIDMAGKIQRLFEEFKPKFEALGAAFPKIDLSDLKQRKLWDEQVVPKFRDIAGLDLTDLRQGVLFDDVKTAQAANLIGIAKKENSVWQEWWRNAILSAPTTHIVNTISNAAHGVWHFTAQRMAESLLNYRGTSIDAATMEEYRQVMAGVMPGLSRGAANFLRSWRAEQPFFEYEVLGEQGPMKIEKGGVAIRGRFGRIVRMPQRLLLAADEFWKSLYAQMEVGAQAHRLAKETGITPDKTQEFIQNQVMDLRSLSWARALNVSRELVFQPTEQERTAPMAERPLAARVSHAAKVVRRTVPGLYYFAPFIETPTKIFQAGVRKSPVGSLNLLREALRAYQTGDRSKLLRLGAEQALAWMVFLGLVGLVDDEDPWITGAAESIGYGKRQTSYREGMPQPQSIKVGGRWYSYARLEPFATALSGMVDLIMAVKRGESIKTAGLQNLVGQLKDKTFLTGISDILDFFEDPSRFEDKLERWATNFTVSWIPNLIRSSGRSMQRYYPERGVWGTTDRHSLVLRRLLQRSELGLLPDEPKVDLWGRKAERPRSPVPHTDFFWRLLFPGKSKEASEPFVGDRFLLAWNAKHPDQEYHPWPAQKTYQWNGERRYMTPEQYTEFLEQAGKSAASKVETFVALRKQNGDWDLDNPQKWQLESIKRLISLARRQTKERLAPKWAK